MQNVLSFIKWLKSEYVLDCLSWKYQTNSNLISNQCRLSTSLFLFLKFSLIWFRTIVKIIELIYCRYLNHLIGFLNKCKFDSFQIIGRDAEQVGKYHKLLRERDQNKCKFGSFQIISRVGKNDYKWISHASCFAELFFLKMILYSFISIKLVKILYYMLYPVPTSGSLNV